MLEQNWRKRKHVPVLVTQCDVTPNIIEQYLVTH